MTVKEIKTKMLKWQDFYGGDLFDTEAIHTAKTKKELAGVLDRHRDHMEAMLLDAFSHLDNFKNKIGLSSL